MSTRNPHSATGANLHDGHEGHKHDEPGDAIIQTPGQTPGQSPARKGSVRFRAGAAADDGQAMLDPANQSLAEALNFLLNAIYIIVALLFVAYAFSGVRRVNEGWRAVKLWCGKVTEPNVAPGLVTAWPFPVGQIVKIDQAPQSTDILKEFWVYIQDSQVNQSLESMGMGTDSLQPDQGGSGSLITGDGNLVHARWSGRYRRAIVRDYAENVTPEFEERMVRAAVMRGIVHAAASTDVDKMLRQSAEQEDSVAARARAVAQATLDAAKSGIIIESLNQTEVTPPLNVRKNFQDVQSAVAKSQGELERARTDATQALNKAAGDASEFILDHIDAYDAALSAKDQAKASDALAQIERAMTGESVEWKGQQRAASGEVTSIVSSARSYRTNVVSRARSDAQRFEVMHGQYRQNAGLMLQREWGDAVLAFTKRPTVTQMFVPPGDDRDMVQILINQDPSIARDIEKKLNEEEATRARARQLERQKNEGIKTDTQVIESGG